MPTVLRGLLTLLLLFAAGATDTEILQAADRWKFSVQFSRTASEKPFTGRVFLFFSQRLPEPRLGPNWFNPELFVARDVEDWKPDTPLTFASTEDAASMLAYPVPLEQMDLAGYRAQAVLRLNPWEREIGTGAGNAFSRPTSIVQTGDQTQHLVDRLVPERKFQETKWTKLLSVKSELLSAFYGRDVHQNAAVLLPASYESQPQRRYPVQFQIPGFGGDHFDGVREQPVNEQNEGGVEFIRVTLDPSCPLGHHVFADSENNGPRGRCLVEEFIPELDRQFRTIAAPTARFLTGHSSGGWSSLWVQVAYPDHFGGTWSTAPDPVDFRDFQRINLYQPGENMFIDADGKDRPLARVAGRVRLWYRGFSDMEHVLGPGGQLHSFEAVFSSRGPDGRPKLVYDRKTGAVDTAVAKTWEKYDIRLILEQHRATLEPKLNGKLHVLMGDQDTFYLEGATQLLKQSQARLGTDAVIEMIPGRDHMNLLTPDVTQRIRREMVAAFLKAHPEGR